MTAVDDTRYAVCLTCGVDLQTPKARDEHVAANWEPVIGPEVDGRSNMRRSHRYQVLNPTPQERAQRHVDLAVEDAINRFLYDMDRDIERGRYDHDDITRALRSYPDFSDAWENYLAEDAG